MKMTLEFCNPLYKRGQNDSAPLSQADPYILEEDGIYYVYCTGADGVHLFCSGNFNDWEYRGIVLTEAGQKEYWAPSAVKYKGKFYIYYSAMPIPSQDVHLQAIRVAESDSPCGPFEFKNVILPPFSIDAHVVENQDDLFMFYCVNDYESERAGTIIVVDKMKNPYEVEGAPVRCVVPTLDEEIFQKDRFRKGQHWHTIEGAFYFKNGGNHFLMYSGSAYTKESYFIGYAVAEGEETDLRKLSFVKKPSDDVYAPVMRKDENVEGTGHNSVMEIGGKHFIVYHGRTTGDKSKYGNEDCRMFRADLLEINGKTLSSKQTITKNKIEV